MSTLDFGRVVRIDLTDLPSLRATFPALSWRATLHMWIRYRWRAFMEAIEPTVGIEFYFQGYEDSSKTLWINTRVVEPKIR